MALHGHSPPPGSSRRRQTAATSLPSPAGQAARASSAGGAKDEQLRASLRRPSGRTMAWRAMTPEAERERKRGSQQEHRESLEGAEPPTSG